VRKDGRKGKDETDDNSNSSNPFPRSTILQRETFKEEKIWAPFDLPRISHLDPFRLKASLQTFLQMGHGTETEGGVGRGTGDGTKWEGEAPAEPHGELPTME
jgi:hypothetical protein